MWLSKAQDVCQRVGFRVKEAFGVLSLCTCRPSAGTLNPGVPACPGGGRCSHSRA